MTLYRVLDACSHLNLGCDDVDGGLPPAPDRLALLLLLHPHLAHHKCHDDVEIDGVCHCCSSLAKRIIGCIGFSTLDFSALLYMLNSFIERVIFMGILIRVCSGFERKVEL